MEYEYVLKHRDTEIAEFSIRRDFNRISGLKIFNEKFSPVNGGEDELSRAISFNSWLSERCIPNSREGVERIKKQYKIEEMKQIMIYLYGLSLSDHYWIDRKPFNKKWADINLFENRYDDQMGRMMFDGKLKLVEEVGSYKGRNPDFSTGGLLRKYWKYDEKRDKSYLYKAGSKRDFQEPFNEYFSHLLMEQLKFEHTPYVLEKVGNEYMSVCPCIADSEYEMVSGVDVRRKYGIRKSFEEFVGLGEKKSCVNFRDDVERMIILDFLTDNIDRHWHNFGILRNGENGCWKGLIPVFDNGYSLWNKDFVNPKILSESMSFSDSNLECLKMVNTRKHVSEIPDMVGIFDQAFEKYENVERKDFIREGIKGRMEDIRMYIKTGNGVEGKRTIKKGKKI